LYQTIRGDSRFSISSKKIVPLAKLARVKTTHTNSTNVSICTIRKSHTNSKLQISNCLESRIMHIVWHNKVYNAYFLYINKIQNIVDICVL